VIVSDAHLLTFQNPHFEKKGFTSLQEQQKKTSYSGVLKQETKGEKRGKQEVDKKLTKKMKWLVIQVNTTHSQLKHTQTANFASQFLHK